MPVIPRTATASVGWDNQGIRLAVYTQDPEGYVRESQWNGNAWILGGPQNRLFLAKKNTPLAAYGFQDSPGAQPKIRLYWVDANNILQQHCYDVGRGWYRGAISDYNIPVHPQTQLAACMWGKQMRIYFQDPTNALTQEWRWDGATWAPGEPVAAKAKVGSPLTACYLHGAPKVFYLSDDDYIRVQLYDTGKWTPGAFVYPSYAGTSFAAITTGEQNISLYLLWPKGEIAHCDWDGKWGLPLRITDGMLATTLSACTTLQLLNPNFKRVYFQVEPNFVVEQCNDGGAWYRGAGVPTK